jgi:thiamine biosynthesis lipoprotein
VDPRLFRLLEDCAALSRATNTAFDVTIGPLVRLWRAAAEQDRAPEPDEIAIAKDLVGVDLIELDDESFTVGFKRPGVRIDLGAYAKGYALERAAGLLRDAGIQSALLHGGTSSVCTIGRPPGDESWRIQLEKPLWNGPEPVQIELKDSALSVSAVHGRSYEIGGRTYGHVIDPRSGRPVSKVLGAAAAGPSATRCEALSTAVMVSGFETPEADWRASFGGYTVFAAPADGGPARTLSSAGRPHVRPFDQGVPPVYKAITKDILS